MDIFKMNLQLFADEDPETPEVEETEDVEIEEEIEGEGIELEPDEELEDIDDSEEPEAENPEKTVPLKALEAERKKYRDRLNDPKLKKAMALAEKLAAATGKDYDGIMAELDSIEVQRQVSAGVPKEIAEAFVAQQREIAEVRKSLNKQKYDIEVEQLKKNAFYSDIDDVRDSVEEYAATKGVTLKEAYNALYADNKYTSMETAIEQRILNNLAKKQGKKLDTTSNGTVKVQSNVKLSPEQKAMAKMAGMTELEYYNMLHISDVEQYKKLKKK